MRAENKPDRALRQASCVIPERFLTHFPARSERSPSGSQLFSTAFPTGQGRDGTGPQLHGGELGPDDPSGAAPQAAPQGPARPRPGSPGRAVRAARGRRRQCLTGRSAAEAAGGAAPPPRSTQGALSPGGHRPVRGAAPTGICLLQRLSHRRE